MNAQPQVWKAQQLQVSFHLVPDGVSYDFTIIEHVEIESLAQTFAASQSFPAQVHCVVPQSQAVVWAAINHMLFVFWSKVKSSEAVESAAFPFQTAYPIQGFLVP